MLDEIKSDTSVGRDDGGIGDHFGWLGTFYGISKEIAIMKMKRDLVKQFGTNIAFSDE